MCGLTEIDIWCISIHQAPWILSLQCVQLPVTVSLEKHKICGSQEIIISIFSSSFVFLVGSYRVIKTNFGAVFQALKPECLNICFFKLCSSMVFFLFSSPNCFLVVESQSRLAFFLASLLGCPWHGQCIVCDLVRSVLLWLKYMCLPWSHYVRSED